MSGLFDGSLDGLSDLSGNDVAGSLLSLPTSKVKSRAQVRQVFKNIKELAQTIQEDGQHQPIVVDGPDDQGFYHIQEGERRWRACKLLGIEVIAWVRNEYADDSTGVVSQLVENIQRDDLNCFEIGDALHKLIDEGGHKKSDIASRIGKKPQYVSMHLAVTDIPEETKRLCLKRDLSLDMTYELSRLYRKGGDGFSLAIDTLEQGQLSRALVRDLSAGGSDKPNTGSSPVSEALNEETKAHSSSPPTEEQNKERNKTTINSDPKLKISPAFAIDGVSCHLLAELPSSSELVVVRIEGEKKELALDSLRVIKVLSD